MSTKLKIFQPSKSVMQSGKKRLKWKIVFESEKNDKFVENLMKRTSSCNNLYQISLEFDSKESALCYAKKTNLPFEILEPTKFNIIKKSYLSK
ncbi:MAG: ETC complex I subunit [Rickettsia sp.]|nr:ETC complex I subunit [Rickettsia sp.]